MIQSGPVYEFEVAFLIAELEDQRSAASGSPT